MPAFTALPSKIAVKRVFGLHAITRLVTISHTTLAGCMIMDERKVDSVIDANTIAKGGMKSRGNVRVHGLLEGELVSQECVIIAQSGRVRGEVRAKEAVIEGRVKGIIEASGRVVIAGTGEIESDVIAPSLSVQIGAKIKGCLVITPSPEERERFKRQQGQNRLTPTLQTLELSIPFPDAKQVQLIGDFNDWDESRAITFHRSENGAWSTEIQLLSGTYEYLLIVDGQHQPDPLNPQKRPNSYGGENSVLTVM